MYIWVHIRIWLNVAMPKWCAIWGAREHVDIVVVKGASRD